MTLSHLHSPQVYNTTAQCKQKVSAAKKKTAPKAYMHYGRCDDITASEKELAALKMSNE